jgi:hypothetical protein
MFHRSTGGLEKHEISSKGKGLFRSTRTTNHKCWTGSLASWRNTGDLLRLRGVTLGRRLIILLVGFWNEQQTRSLQRQGNQAGTV